MTMKRQQKALDVSGKETTDRLSSIASHITRIDDLDKKLAAVTSKLNDASQQMVKSAEQQQLVSGDLQEMKTQHAQQFNELNNRLLTNMESQQKMSTTMMDIQAQFENISIFIHQLSQRMEQERNQALDTPQTSLPIFDGTTLSARSTSSKSESFATQQSDESSAESTVYRSPDQKRQRSARNSTNQPQTDSFSTRETKATEESTTISYMEVCTDLDAAFQRQASLPAQALQPRVGKETD
jgi:hypothetical protein